MWKLTLLYWVAVPCMAFGALMACLASGWMLARLVAWLLRPNGIGLPEEPLRPAPRKKF